MQAVCSQTLDTMSTLSSPTRLLFPQSSNPNPTKSQPPSQDDLKRAAAHKAVDLAVTSNIVTGLGTGPTAIHALDRIAALLRPKTLTNIVGIPTSKKTERQALALNIPLSDLNSHPQIGLSIDGADEVDPGLNLIKGRGGSLLREKMIESASKRFIVIVDESKMVDKLGGSKMAVPVEVIPFGWNLTLMRLKKLFEGRAAPGFDARLRIDEGDVFVTDNGNFIVELFFEEGVGGNLEEVSDEILKIVGVVEHGMFLGMATEVIVAGKDGVTMVTREEALAAKRGNCSDFCGGNK